VIVAMVGTGPDSLDRLVRPLDELAGRHGWDVFVQLGHTGYEPLHCRFERFVDRDALLQMIESAELVITQGGYGGIRDALLFDKPIVAVPRYPALRESPDHQEEMVKAMEERGYLIGVYDIAQLEAAIQRARNFIPSARTPSFIPDMLADYVGRVLV
jgi:UDP-N-acetylglucosamine transferase subunit ALG13